jgi:hypothetical protein
MFHRRFRRSGPPGFAANCPFERDGRRPISRSGQSCIEGAPCGCACRGVWPGAWPATDRAAGPEIPVGERCRYSATSRLAVPKRGRLVWLPATCRCERSRRQPTTGFARRSVRCGAYSQPINPNRTGISSPPRGLAGCVRPFGPRWRWPDLGQRRQPRERRPSPGVRLGDVAFLPVTSPRTARGPSSQTGTLFP